MAARRGGGGGGELLLWREEEEVKRMSCGEKHGSNNGFLERTTATFNRLLLPFFSLSFCTSFYIDILHLIMNGYLENEHGTSVEVSE